MDENSSPTFQITTQKRNGKNYLHWSNLATMVIRGKGKYAFVDGFSHSSQGDPSYTTWEVQQLYGDGVAHSIYGRHY